jgi:hypothetical protein
MEQNRRLIPGVAAQVTGGRIRSSGERQWMLKAIDDELLQLRREYAELGDA